MTSAIEIICASLQISSINFQFYCWNILNIELHYIQASLLHTLLIACMHYFRDFLQLKNWCLVEPKYFQLLPVIPLIYHCGTFNNVHIHLKKSYWCHHLFHWNNFTLNICLRNIKTLFYFICCHIASINIISRRFYCTTYFTLSVNWHFVIKIILLCAVDIATALFGCPNSTWSSDIQQMSTAERVHVTPLISSSNTSIRPWNIKISMLNNCVFKSHCELRIL